MRDGNLRYGNGLLGHWIDTMEKFKKVFEYGFRAFAICALKFQFKFYL